MAEADRRSTMDEFAAEVATADTVLVLQEAEPMMNGMAGMGWGMNLIGLLVLIVLVLGISALVKYLRSGGK